MDTRAISTGVHTVILWPAIELVSMCLSSLLGLAILSRAVLERISTTTPHQRCQGQNQAITYLPPGSSWYSSGESARGLVDVGLALAGGTIVGIAALQLERVLGVRGVAAIDRLRQRFKSLMRLGPPLIEAWLAVSIVARTIATTPVCLSLVPASPQPPFLPFCQLL